MEILFVGKHDQRLDYVVNELSERRATIVRYDEPIEAIGYASNNVVDMIFVADNMKVMSGDLLILIIREIHPKVVSVLCVESTNDTLELNALKWGVNLVLDITRDEKLLWLKVENCIELLIGNKSVLEKGSVHINYLSHSVFYRGVEVYLTPREFEMLDYFLRHTNKVVSRSEMIEAIWDVAVAEYVDERTVDVHVKRLRDKLGAENLLSVRGIGYKWIL